MKKRNLKEILSSGVTGNDSSLYTGRFNNFMHNVEC